MKNYILQNENAIYYECKFSCDNVIFLSLGEEKFFITDGRYSLEAKEYLQNIEVLESDDLIKTTKEILKKNNIKKIYFDPYDFTVSVYNKLIYKSSTKFISSSNFSKKKRAIKSDDEIEILTTAANIGKYRFNKLGEFIQNHSNLSEKFLHFKTKEILSNQGEFELSFDPIVVFNKNSAKPHSLPTNKKLNKNDLILIDGGIKYERYCSDRTITSSLTKKINFAKRDQVFKKNNYQKIYDIVLKAQQKTISKIRVGMKANEIDKIARDIIDKSGYGEYFVHSTGHGVGLDIHELPFISKRSDTIIEENMVFTIEPGIYLPNTFGVRIEDMVVIKNGKANIL